MRRLALIAAVFALHGVAWAEEWPEEVAPAPSAAASEHEKSVWMGSASQPLARGVASWYGLPFHGRRTASGERFDMTGFTAAHPTLPFGTRVKVRSLVNGREVTVRINDRGPHTGGRIIDLSHAAARALGLLSRGTKLVELIPAD